MLTQPSQWSADQVDLDQLTTLADRARYLVLKAVADSKAGHVGGPLSAIDLLVALYFRVLRIRTDEPHWPDRDRFVLSKGHSCIGLYAVLALRGFFDVSELGTFDRLGSRLQGHPDMRLLPGLDASSGSLGQGLAFGAGLALGARHSGRANHTWVMLGDGELQEGMVWESVQVAARYRLDNLTAVVDLNGLQQYGWPDEGDNDRGDRADPWARTDLRAAFTAFGWRVVEFDGHDFTQILAAYTLATTPHPDRRPTVLLARTVKGHGISFAEGRYSWHTGIATDQQLRQAADELGLVQKEVAPW